MFCLMSAAAIMSPPSPRGSLRLETILAGTNRRHNAVAGPESRTKDSPSVVSAENFLSRQRRIVSARYPAAMPCPRYCDDWTFLPARLRRSKEITVDKSLLPHDLRRGLLRELTIEWFRGTGSVGGV